MTTAEVKSRDFVTAREFAAPRELVWKCFTEAERMKEWFGPKGSIVVSLTMDVRVGGTFHGALRDGSGQVMWAKFVYREVAAPARLVWLHSFADEAGNLVRHPLRATWPLQLRTTVTFEALPGNKTKVTLRWSPFNATAEEQSEFDAAHESMRQGWSGSFDQLDAYLATAR